MESAWLQRGLAAARTGPCCASSIAAAAHGVAVPQGWQTCKICLVAEHEEPSLPGTARGCKSDEATCMHVQIELLSG